MYKLVLSNEHLTILKEAFRSFFLIRQNHWEDFISDIEPIRTEVQKDFEEAYKTASPDYKKLYKIIRNESGEIEDVTGFSETIKTVFLKVFRNELLFDSTSELRSLLYVVEEYMRMRMGQFFTFTDDVAHNGWEYNNSNPHNSVDFDEYISRRNMAENMFNVAYKKAIPFRIYKLKTVLIAEDMYDVLKYQIYLDTPSMHSSYHCWSLPPMHWTDLPTPKIEVL